MDISKVFREVFKKKAKMLSEEKEREDEGLPPIKEAPGIGDTQKKFLSYQKAERVVPLMFKYSEKSGAAPTSPYRDKINKIDLDVYLSNNETQALKELIKEFESTISSQNNQVMIDNFKEIFKALKKKSGDFSMDMLDAISALMKAVKNHINNKMRNPGGNTPSTTKFDSSIDLLDSMINYVDKSQFEELEYKEPEGITQAINVEKPVSDKLAEIRARQQKAIKSVSGEGMKGGAKKAVMEEVMRRLAQMSGSSHYKGGAKEKVMEEVRARLAGCGRDYKGGAKAKVMEEVKARLAGCGRNYKGGAKAKVMEEVMARLEKLRNK